MDYGYRGHENSIDLSRVSHLIRKETSEHSSKHRLDGFGDASPVDFRQNGVGDMVTGMH